jgi:hypothetical protein
MNSKIRLQLPQSRRLALLRAEELISLNVHVLQVGSLRLNEIQHGLMLHLKVDRILRQPFLVPFLAGYERSSA